MENNQNELQQTIEISDLPHSQGLSFSTLDGYLAHLRSLAPQDRPYFEEIAPSQFRRVTGRRAPGTEEDQTVYTRQQLLDQFGFEE